MKQTLKQTLFASCLIGAFALCDTVSAQSVTDGAPVGLQAASFMIRIRAIGVIPEDNSSSTSIGGHVSTTAQPAPEVDFSYFFTDNIAAELIAASTRHNIKATGTAVGDVDVGSAWVLPPTLTAQVPFLPARPLQSLCRCRPDRGVVL